jgi:hypothetical protein
MPIFIFIHCIVILVFGLCHLFRHKQLSLPDRWVTGLVGKSETSSETFLQNTILKSAVNHPLMPPPLSVSAAPELPLQAMSFVSVMMPGE